MQLDKDDIADIKSKVSITDLLAQHGIKTRGRMCLCPFHNERNPSCEVFEREGRIWCYRCGKGGDHFDFLRDFRGMHFNEAAAFLGGADRRELTFEERKAIRARQEAAEKEKKTEDRKKVDEACKLFERGDEIKGTLAATYLKNRGLTVSKRMWMDLRYIDKLTYWGFPDRDADKREALGDFPCLLSAIRNPATGAQIGTHRTFIDRQTGLKLPAPGDASRNRSKKIMGNSDGGLIFLSAPADMLVLGEGIETSLSGYELEIGGRDAAVAAGISIYNICGSSLGSLPHPKVKDKRIPDGLPDPAKPGLKPPTWVKKMVLLGDGDSEPYWTRAMLACAAQRFTDWMIDATIVMAPKGKDFNDIHLEELAL